MLGPRACLRAASSPGCVGSPSTGSRAAAGLQLGSERSSLGTAHPRALGAVPAQAGRRWALGPLAPSPAHWADHLSTPQGLCLVPGPPRLNFYSQGSRDAQARCFCVPRVCKTKDLLSGPPGEGRGCTLGPRGRKRASTAAGKTQTDSLAPGRPALGPTSCSPEPRAQPPLPPPPLPGPWPPDHCPTRPGLPQSSHVSLLPSPCPCPPDPSPSSGSCRSSPRCLTQILAFQPGLSCSALGEEGRLLSSPP